MILQPILRMYVDSGTNKSEKTPCQPTLDNRSDRCVFNLRCLLQSHKSQLPDQKGHLTKLARSSIEEIQAHASDLHKIGLVALHPSFILVELVEPLLIAVAGPLLSIDSSEV